MDADARGAAPGATADEPPSRCSGARTGHAGASTPSRRPANTRRRPEQDREEPASRQPALPRHRRDARSGRAFAGPIATASFAACRSRPTGRSRRRSSCGAGRSGPGWSSFAVQRRSALHAGAARRRRDRRLLPGDAPASRCGGTRRGPLLGIERRRRSARHADAQQRPRLHVRRDRNPERARCRAPARVVWSRNAATDAQAKVPIWGFSSSPLVVDDVVIVAAGGHARRLRRRDRRRRAGSARQRAASYSSPHLVTIDGVDAGPAPERHRRDSVAPADGTVLWEHEWPGGAHRAAGADRGRRHPDQRRSA